MLSAEVPSEVASVALESLRALPINTLFADAVLTGSMDGSFLCNSSTEPTAFYVVHKYGMALLWGHWDGPADPLVPLLTDPRKSDTWLQVYPEDVWVPLVRAALVSGGRPVDEHVRVNFAFNRDAFHRELAAAPPAGGVEIIATTAALFDAIDGTVVPKMFWPDADHFLAAGGGRTAMIDGKPAATAFVSFRRGLQAELGIETAECHRGGGLARRVTCEMIEACVAAGLEPVWACREGNVGSFRLALRVGFEVARRLAYFRVAATPA